MVGGGHIASHVTLAHRRNRLRCEKIMQDKLMEKVAADRITLRWNSQVDEVPGDDRGVSHVRLRSTTDGTTEEIAVDGVFIAIGHHPNTDLFAGQIEMDGGYIVTQGGRHGMAIQTSIPGVLAAGDVQDQIYRQAVTSAASGCQAALGAERYLDGVRRGRNRGGARNGQLSSPMPTPAAFGRTARTPPPA